MISLFYMSKVRFGGFVSYTTHLARALKEAGHDCRIYKVRKRTEKNERDFGDGVGSLNVSIEDALRIISNSEYSIITATWWKGWSEDISKLLEAGAEVVIHDHTEYNQEFIELMDVEGVRPITIRETNTRNLKEKGLYPVFVPHPYVPHFSDIPVGVRPYRAISVARMDYDKRTALMIEANEILPMDLRIQFWGTHTRAYMYQKIVGKFEGWDDPRHYTGPCYPREQQHFPKEPGFAATLNSQAEFSCDMSAIVGDGGGTQYSFLEAIDGGAVVVLNRDWFVHGFPNELKDEVNCLAVVDAADLADLLLYNRREDWLDIVDNSTDILADHSYVKVVPLLMRFLDDGYV